MGDSSDVDSGIERFDRREFLIAIATASSAVTLQPAEAATKSLEKSSPADTVSEGTYFLPSLLRSNDQKYAAWTDSIAVRNGELILAVPLSRLKKDSVLGYDPEGAMGFSIAKSADGVHWQELEKFACRLEHGVPGFCMRWTGREFIIYVTERNPSSPEETLSPAEPAPAAC